MKEREALELAQRALSNKRTSDETIYKALNAIKEVLAEAECDRQPEQRSVSEHLEPVEHISLKALEQIKPPMLVLNNVPIYGYNAEGTVAVYTTPPQRQPLTDELKALLASVLGDCYLGKEKEEELVSIIRKQYRALPTSLQNEAANGIKGDA